MSAVRLIARREWLAITCSFTGLVVMVLYLVLSGYLFAYSVSQTMEATLRHTFASMGVLTIFIIPLITMRLLSEELRSGTFEVLVANPVTDMQIILGKFLAGWWSFLIMSSPTLLYLIILMTLGSPDWGPAITGYLGLQFMAAMLIALGLLISASTQNQVLAAMGAMVGGVVLMLAGTAAYSFGGRMGAAFSYLAVLEHFALFRRGVLDSRALFYLLASTAVFLFLATRVVESRRWKFGVTPGSEPARWKRPGLCIFLALMGLMLVGEVVFARFSRGFWSFYNTGLLVIGIALIATPILMNRPRFRYEMGRRQTGLALTVFLNCLLAIAAWSMGTYLSSRYFVRMDLTSSKRYTLSEQTRQVVTGLQSPVEIIVALTSPTDLLQEIRDLIAEYTARTNLVTVQYLDPQRSPSEVERLRERYQLLSPLSNEVLVAVGERSRRIPASAFVQQSVRTVEGRQYVGPPQFVGEAEITSALVQLTRESPGRIIFLSGHGQRSPDEQAPEGAARAVAELRRSGWVVHRHIITPGAGASFPVDTQVVILAGPRKRLSDEDLRALQEVLDRGGGVMILLDPGVDAGLESLIHPWNVRLGNDMVVDLKDFVSSGDPTSLYVTRFAKDHVIGKGMGSLAAVVPTARRVAVTNIDPNPNVSTRNFMHTSGDAWAVPYQESSSVRVNPRSDRRGPISLGIACERYQEFYEPGRSPLSGRMVVIGDSDFMSNQYIDMAGNLNLFLNSVDWLAGRHDLISVRPKVADIRYIPLTNRQSKLIYWSSVLLIPLAALMAGLLMTARRRRST